MQPFRTFLLGRILRSATLAVSLTALTGCASSPNRFEFGLIGDTPYSAADEMKLAMVFRAMDKADLAFVAHVGDLQPDPRGYRDGSPPCTDETLANRKAMLQASKHPVVVTPGDNDWADCHFSKPSLDPLVRLAAVRAAFFADDRTLGQRSFTVSRQSDDPKYFKYRENIRYTHGDVLFITLHIVGSNNNLGRAADADKEYDERNAANLNWLQQAFEQATKNQHKGMVIMTQANPYFETGWPQFYTRALRVAPAPAPSQPAGFKDFRAALEIELAKFDRPVLLAHGDTHYFRVDKPLFGLKSQKQINNLTRVETFGSPNVHWVRVVVDTTSQHVFTITPEIVNP